MPKEAVVKSFHERRNKGTPVNAPANAQAAGTSKTGNGPRTKPTENNTANKEKAGTEGSDKKRKTAADVVNNVSTVMKAAQALKAGNTGKK